LPLNGRGRSLKKIFYLPVGEKLKSFCRNGTAEGKAENRERILDCGEERGVMKYRKRRERFHVEG